MLQVGVAEVDEAEGIFSTLIGDIVEPPRLFIQAHALNLVNLDEQGVNIISVEHCSYGKIFNVNPVKSANFSTYFIIFVECSSLIAVFHSRNNNTWESSET